MNNLLKKTWFQIIFFGLLIGTALIIIDKKFDLLPAKKESEKFEGIVEADKDKMYFTKMEVKKTSFDFGKVKEGDTVIHSFKIKNTGNEPLFIFKAAGSCDCIAANFSSSPLSPDSTTEVIVAFNTIGRKGEQTRTITLNTNTEPAETTLTFTGKVE